MYWSQALATQDAEADLKAKFVPLAQALTEQEKTIVQELNAAQGSPVDMGGYYQPDTAKLDAAMRPSVLFNEALAAL
jgi:isocitrate dehydrogenase